MRFVVVLSLLVAGAFASDSIGPLEHRVESLPGLEQFASARVEHHADFAQTKKSAKFIKKSTKGVKHVEWTKSTTCPGDAQGFCVVKYGNRQFEMVQCDSIEKNVCTQTSSGKAVPCTKEKGFRKIICVEENIEKGKKIKDGKAKLAASEVHHAKCISDHKLRDADPTRGGMCVTGDAKSVMCKEFDEYFNHCTDSHGKSHSCDCIKLAMPHKKTHTCLPPEKLKLADPTRGGSCAHGSDHSYTTHCLTFSSDMTHCNDHHGRHFMCACVAKAFRPKTKRRKCIPNYRVRKMADPTRGGECRVKGRDMKCAAFTSDYKWCIGHSHHDQKCQCITKAYRPHPTGPMDENYRDHLRELKRTKKSTKKSTSSRRRRRANRRRG